MVTRSDFSKRIGSSTWKRYIEFLPPQGQAGVPQEDGAFGGVWVVTLWNDSGTPTDNTDDCGVTFTAAQSPPTSPGWNAFDFAVDAASPTLPAGWLTEGPCGGTPDQVWNLVIQDVVAGYELCLPGFHHW